MLFFLDRQSCFWGVNIVSYSEGRFFLYDLCVVLGFIVH